MATTTETASRFRLLSSCCGSPLDLTSLDQIAIVSRACGDDGALLWTLNCDCCGEYLDADDLKLDRATSLVAAARRHVWLVSIDQAERQLERDISQLRDDHLEQLRDFAEAVGKVGYA